MSKNDCNFDSRTKTFKNNIYGTGKGKIREAILMRDISEYLQDKQSVNILDVGGGQGQISLQLAKLGFDVTLTDISQDMLDVAKNSAQQLGLNNITFLQSALQQLPEKLSKQYDLVLCHAVFEWLDDPKQAFELLNYFCASDGAISLMFYNQAGQTLSNLVYGNFDYIRAGMKAKKVVKLNPQSSLKSETVLDWCTEQNLSVNTKSGVRCFHDYMRDISKWETDFDNILQMELAYSQQEPFASIGRYMHLLLIK